MGVQYDNGDLFVYNSSGCFNIKDFGTSFTDVLSLTVYNGKLYAGLGNGDNDGDVYEYNGTTWERSKNFATHTLSSLIVYNGKLYAGLGGNDGEGDLWVFDGNTWSLSKDFDTDIDKVQSLGVYNGKLYAGLGSDDGEGDIYEYDGTTWTLSKNFSSSINYVMSMVVYNGKLYAGLGNDAGEGDLWVFDGHEWTESYEAGANMDVISSSIVYNGKLYIGTGDTNGESEIYVYSERLESQLHQVDNVYETSFNEMTQHFTKDLTVLGGVGIGTSNPSYKLEVDGNVNLNNTLYVTESGNVGIGTDSPEQILHVASDAAVYELENTRSTIGMGYNAGSWIFTAGVAGKSTVGEIRYTATENWNDTSSPTRMQFSTTPVGSTQATAQMTIMPNGSVGIGTVEPQALLHIDSDNNETVLILQDVDGTCTFNPEAGETVFSCSSDKKLKKDIKNASSALEEFEDINIRDYVVKASGKNMTGVIAQEINETHPEMVHIEDGELFVEVPSSWKLLKAIQELKAMFESLVGGNYSVESKVVFNEDSIGTATVLINETEVEIIFEEEYEVVPIITATPIGLPNFFYGVDEITTSGFKILISEVQEKEVKFNWHAFAQSPRDDFAGPEVKEVVNVTLNETIPEINITILNETEDVNISIPDKDNNDNNVSISINETESTNVSEEINQTIPAPQVYPEAFPEEMPTGGKVNITIPENNETEEKEKLEKNLTDENESTSLITGGVIGTNNQDGILTRLVRFIGGLFN
jgi:hypothetical protein